MQKKCFRYERERNMITTVLGEIRDKENYSTKDTENSNGLLLHAVYAKPLNVGIDECNIWGCYYYLEALVRMIKGTRAYW